MPLPTSRFSNSGLLLAGGVALWAGAALAQPDAEPPATGVSAAPGATQSAAAAPPGQSGMTARLMYELLVSEMSFDQGQERDATRIMLAAARRTNDAGLFKRATEMAIQSRHGPAALEAARAWRRAHPDSFDAGQYELQVLIALGRLAGTEVLIQDLLKRLSPADQTDFINALPIFYQKVADKRLAAQSVERGLAEAVDNPALAAVAWTSIGRVRLDAGDKAGALVAAALAQGSNAASEWPALLALQLSTAGVQEAEAMVQRYLQTPESRPDVHIVYARSLVEQQRLADAHEALARLIRIRPEEPDAWLVQGALYADEGQAEKARASLERYLSLAAQPGGADDSVTQDGEDEEAEETDAQAPAGAGRARGLDQARLLLAGMAEQRGDWAEADKLLAAVTSPAHALSVHARRAAILARQGQLDQGLQLLRQAPETGPEDAQAKLRAEAQLLQQNGRAAQAYPLLKDALQQAPDNETLIYETALAADQAGDHAEMERLLRRLIRLWPNEPDAYNALGYSLADRNLRLKEAKTLIEKAVALSPQDAYIQDSLGWVEFRMGHVQRARDLLQAAFRMRPDAEIAAHLGEVLWTLNEREAALDIWREGLRLNADNKTLRETLKRFQVQP